MAPMGTLIVLISTYILSIQNTNAQLNTTTSSCQPNEPCIIDCDRLECYNLTITCPIDKTCTINCNQDDSCEELTIDATFATSLSINGCVSNETCSDLNIICPDSSDPKSCDGEKCKHICINNPPKGILYNITISVYIVFHVLVNSTFLINACPFTPNPTNCH